MSSHHGGGGWHFYSGSGFVFFPGENLPPSAQLEGVKVCETQTAGWDFSRDGPHDVSGRGLAHLTTSKVSAGRAPLVLGNPKQNPERSDWCSRRRAGEILAWRAAHHRGNSEQQAQLSASSVKLYTFNYSQSAASQLVVQRQLTATGGDKSDFFKEEEERTLA